MLPQWQTIKKPLSEIINVTEEIKALEDQQDIFGRSSQYYVENPNNVNTKQDLIIDKFKSYLKLNNRDPELFNQEGYCNGFTLMTHFWDSLLKHDIYKKVLEALVQWDKTPEGLEKKLEGDLAQYQTVGQLFEKFLSPLTMTQQIRKLDFSLLQEGRGVQLAFLGQAEGFQQLFQPMRIDEVNSAQLEEMFDIVRHLPGDTRFELGGSGHVTAFKVNNNHELQYSDSNFETTDWVTCSDAKSFVDVIIQTKYLELNKAIKTDAQGLRYIDDDVRIQGYFFERNNVPMASFNYFHRDELPKTKEDIEQFIAHSSNGFNPFHMVVLTNSKDNFSQLLERDFCLEYLEHRSVAGWWNNSPLSILFENRNESMLRILFDRMHLFSPDEQAVMQNKLCEAISSATSEMKRSIDTQGAQFVIHMVRYLEQDNLSKFFRSTVYLNEPLLLENMLKHKVFDRLDESEFKSVLAERWLPDTVKADVKNHVEAPSDVEQDVEKYLVEMKAKNEAQKENIEACRKVLGTIKNPVLQNLLLDAYNKNYGEGVPSVKQMEAFVSEVGKAQSYREFFKIIRESGNLLALFGDGKNEQFGKAMAVKQEAQVEMKSAAVEDKSKSEVGAPRIMK